jgi:hypothetical protein
MGGCLFVCSSTHTSHASLPLLKTVNTLCLRCIFSSEFAKYVRFRSYFRSCGDYFINISSQMSSYRCFHTSLHTSPCTSFYTYLHTDLFPHMSSHMFLRTYLLTCTSFPLPPPTANPIFIPQQPKAKETNTLCTIPPKRTTVDTAVHTHRATVNTVYSLDKPRDLRSQCSPRTSSCS